MVIDDSKTIRRTAETLLKKAGCDVITATDGYDALADLLASCMADEVHHQQEAQLRVGTPVTSDNLFRWLIGTGSAVAVSAARKI